MGGPALLVTGAIIGFLVSYRDGKWLTTVLTTLLGTLGGCLAFVIITGVLLLVMPTTQYVQSKETIVPLEGSIYLGNGDVNGSIEWSYVTKTRIGNVVNSVKADKILVTVDDKVKSPYVEQVSDKFNSAKIESMFPAEFMKGSATIVHIPANAIKYGYNLNIQN